MDANKKKRKNRTTRNLLDLATNISLSPLLHYTPASALAVTTAGGEEVMLTPHAAGAERFSPTPEKTNVCPKNKRLSPPRSRCRFQPVRSKTFIFQHIWD